MSIIWPWNLRRIAGVVVALVPGESFHQFARRLVDERYGDGAEMIVTELELDGDHEAHATIHVRPPVVAQHVDIRLTTVPIKPDSPASGQERSTSD